MRNHCAFLGKAFGVFLFFFEKRFRHKKREIGVLMPGRLKHIVERTLHLFPDRKTIRLDDHAAANSRVFSQIGTFDDLVIPLGIVFRSFRKCFSHKKISHRGHREHRVKIQMIREKLTGNNVNSLQFALVSLCSAVFSVVKSPLYDRFPTRLSRYRDGLC